MWLTTNAYTWSAAERQVIPALPKRGPSLRAEIRGILAEYSFLAMHGVKRQGNSLALGHEDWRRPIAAAAPWQHGVAVCGPANEGRNWP